MKKTARNDGEFFAPNSRFAFIPIRALADAVNSPTPRLALPSFQRDAVWDERNVELLWDSMLRGFPIGAILLARGRKTVTRQLQRARMAVANPTQMSNSALVLIDGQQRSIAVAMGFRSWRDGDPCRLWLDLAEPTTEKDAAKFRIVLCSVRYPWGQGATEGQKRAARDSAAKHGVAVNTDAPSLDTTWPVRAGLPVPLAEFLALVQGHRGTEWASLLPVALDGLSAMLPAAAAFAERVVAAATELEDYCVPAVLLRELDPEDLGTAFQRLNGRGVPMGPDDLFFSGLKMRWPAAHDLVWQVHGDPRVGKFLMPTQIVHLAARLAVRFQMADQPDLPRLDVEKFRKLADSPSATGGGTFMDGVRHYLQQRTGVGGVGLLHERLRAARRALSYRPVDAADPGLPAPLLARLHWRVWHTVVAWLEATDCVDVGTTDRADIIRFALMDLFCVRRHTETLARALLDEAAKASGAFPGRAIYARLREAGATLVENHLPTPDEFASTVLDDRTDPSRDILQNERLLAMWVQRQWLARWFPHFDPTLFARAEDLPFDLDHIVPAAHINMRGRGWHVSSQFEAWREGLSNSVGNFRYWPKGENRADGEANPGKKHLLGDAIAELPDDATLRRPPYGMRTYAEVRAASYIPEDLREDWAGASTGTGGNYDWKDEKRILAWRRAVMKRRTAMYREVFTVLDFAAWTMGADARPQLQGAEVA